MKGPRKEVIRLNWLPLYNAAGFCTQRMKDFQFGQVSGVDYNQRITCGKSTMASSSAQWVPLTEQVPQMTDQKLKKEEISIWGTVRNGGNVYKLLTPVQKTRHFEDRRRKWDLGSKGKYW